MTNKNYHSTENLSMDDLGDILSKTFGEYDEYEDFGKMCVLFAEDDFYHLHYVAKEYMKKLNEWFDYHQKRIEERKNG